MRKKTLPVLVILAAAVASGLAGPARAAPTFTIRGRGWGHGVGMSQWGAKGLADSGLTGNKILGLFYRGTSLAKVSEPSELRVGLLQGQGRIDVTGNGRWDFHDHFGATRASGASGETWSVRTLAPGTSQLGVFDAGGRLVFTSAAPVTLVWEPYGTLLSLPRLGYRYKHGRIDLDVDLSNTTERAILIAPFEQYLYGLGEMPASWNLEALKAQAIAGRTYALDKVRRLGQTRPGCNCGVYGSTLDQAYVGVAQEVPRWVAAVDQTAGQAIVSGGQPIQAYYSASDGGYTENNENVWGGQPLSYLRGVCDPGDYDGGQNPNANWAVTMDGDAIAQDLAQGGYRTGSVQEMTVLPPRGVSGRVLGVIDSSHGGVRVRGTSATVQVPGYAFQSLLGLKSDLISHSISGAIRLRYDALGCAPGFPLIEPYTWTDLTGVARGTAQDFTNGRLFFGSSSGKVFWVWGPILQKYDALRAKGRDLGLPTSDVFPVSGGYRCTFERGSITYKTSTKSFSVVFS